MAAVVTKGLNADDTAALKKEIEKLVPTGVDNREDIVQTLIDQVLYFELFNVGGGPESKPSFILNNNVLLQLISKEVGPGGNMYGIYNKIQSWRSWAPEEVLKGIRQQEFDQHWDDSAIYGRAGKISASDYGAPNGPVMGGFESDENQ